LICDRDVGLSGSPLPLQTSLFPRGLSRFSSTGHRPPSNLRQTGSSSHKLCASTECCRPSHPPRIRKPEDAFLGVASQPHRDISHPRRNSEIPTPLPLRPRRFSRPRRFHPRTTLWAYFIPQPRPGFTLQGFSLRCSRITSSVTRALSSLPMVRYQQLPTSATFHGPAHRALIRTGIRRKRLGC